jgi:hypothetical protein
MSDLPLSEAEAELLSDHLLSQWTGMLKTALPAHSVVLNCHKENADCSSEQHRETQNMTKFYNVVHIVHA